MRNGKSMRGNIAETKNRALRVLARMRRTGSTLTAAARDEHIDPRTVRKHLAPELRGMAQGRTQPTKSDRRIRQMLIPTSRGARPVAIRGSESASQLGRYMSAVGSFLRTGETKALGRFEGQSIAGHALITDPAILTSLANAGALQLEGIYALPESSS